MGSIFGRVNLCGPTPVSSDLDCVAESLSHRGPDGEGRYLGDQVGIGQHVLHNDPACVAVLEPFRSIEGDFAIVADSRIDNRRQLCKDLGISAGQLTECVDAQLILAAYRLWGERCVEHLLGDFAFAIWDVRKKCLFLARDHMGNKPIYFHHYGGTLLFASSADAVARNEGFSFTINQGRIADFLVGFLEGVDDTCSWYEGIHRLPAGSSLTFDSSGCSQRRYWQPTCGKPTLYGSDEQYLEALVELIEQAILERTRAVGPVGVMLSGGVDSTLLLGYLRQLAPAATRIRTYSAANLENVRCIESKHIGMMTLGDSEATVISPTDFRERMPEFREWYSHLEDPFDLQMVIPSLVYMAASRDGVRAVIDGGDGDLVAGLCSNHLPWLMRHRKLNTAWIEARGIAAMHEGGPGASHYLIGSLKSAIAPGWLRNFRNRTRVSGDISRIILESGISPEFAKHIALGDRISQFKKNNSTSPCVEPGLQHQEMLRWPAVVAGAERYERTAAAWGVEARQPLLDVRIIEFFLNLPWHLKSRQGWSKYLLRKAASLVVPEEIAWQRGRRHVGGSFHQVRCTLDDNAAQSARDRVDGFSGLVVGQDRLQPGPDIDIMLYWLQSRR